LTRKTGHQGFDGPSNGDLALLRSGRNEHLVRAGDEVLHTKRGMIELSELAGVTWGSAVKSHLGTEFVVLRPRAPDFFRHFRRSGAPMMPQDIGLIVALTGLGKNDRVLEAGTGSGILACFLGMIASSVVSYEVRPDAAELARKNLALAGLDNVRLEVGDIFEELPRLAETGETFDVTVLDMGGADGLVPMMPAVLVPGGCLACYSPFTEQMAAVHRSVEAILREQQVSPRGVRPSTRVGHTGFVTVGRSTTGNG